MAARPSLSSPSLSRSVILVMSGRDYHLVYQGLISVLPLPERCHHDVIVESRGLNYSNFANNSCQTGSKIEIVLRWIRPARGVILRVVLMMGVGMELRFQSVLGDARYTSR